MICDIGDKTRENKKNTMEIYDFSIGVGTLINLSIVSENQWFLAWSYKLGKPLK